LLEKEICMYKVSATPRFTGMSSLAIASAICLAVSACKDVRAEADTPSPRAKLVMLEDGTTMTARRGTLGRQLADWLALDGAGSRNFSLGSDAFRSNTAQFSPAGIERAVDLGTVLRATPSAKLTILGDGTGEDALARRRAHALAKFLGSRGILAGQVRVTSEQGTSQSVTLTPPSSLSLRLDRTASVIPVEPSA
jgi:outer membrane protein OmpA-like peptidoglycan-associated protein